MTDYKVIPKVIVGADNTEEDRVRLRNGTRAMESAQQVQREELYERLLDQIFEIWINSPRKEELEKWYEDQHQQELRKEGENAAQRLKALQKELEQIAKAELECKVQHEEEKGPKRERPTDPKM